MANAITTKARVKSRLAISTTDYDDLFDNLIIAVTKRMEVMTDRDFALATYTNELHDGGDWYGSNRTILRPRNAPISNVASVEYKSGTNEQPNWTAFNTNDYDVDETVGIIYFDRPLPSGKRNIRITYTAGWESYDIAQVSGLWYFNTVPTGTVNGSNATFTLAEDADEVIVYADGVRVKPDLVTHTAGTDTFTLAAAAVPYSSIAVDYKATTAGNSGSSTIPADLVEVCERAVVTLFKRRDNEGKTSESYNESSITWRSQVFTNEDLATIKNYKRGDAV